MMAAGLKIGELAQRTGTQVETIRYYEREGLLPEPARSEGNYRLYDKAHTERLSFIRHCRSLDMTLDEIRALLKFRDAPNQECGEVNALLDEHIGHVPAHAGREGLRNSQRTGAAERQDGCRRACARCPRPACQTIGLKKQ